MYACILFACVLLVKRRRAFWLLLCTVSLLGILEGRLICFCPVRLTRSVVDRARCARFGALVAASDPGSGARIIMEDKYAYEHTFFAGYLTPCLANRTAVKK